MIEFERYEYARRLFEERKYAPAARELEGVLASGEGHGQGEAQELYLRALYHSAQLTKAEQTARTMIEHNPTDAYALVVLGRSLYRQGRYEDAEVYLKQAEAFGVSTV
ncbi:tetratricopeptide repeat protein [Yimella sp. cx-51]|uniref:tetratricopeptide repeat protein n=1 Tax=Yimella sp. cx-51 TaxID=2770551 RepID=UPI00165D8511|nr:tetratricopeptide repeat protein [Yimella sp. cx-51]MBC9958297.1 tetratricopeptide repeat protein [Yimella sp. cx-51]MBD2760499.1 tetratricopeptide repeat protein [Yimella sp. cx-573]QTH38255.1 tetratricopeptide repeat protein [Yimella sp. cx-51]